MKNKSKLLLIAGILGALYAIYMIKYFLGINSDTKDDAEAVGAGLATALVMPHMLGTTISAILNLIAWGTSSRGLALTAAIFYCVSAILFPLYGWILIPMIALCFMGYSKLKKLV